MPASRFAMLITADWLWHRLPVFARCSRKLLRHLCKPYWHAGWTNRDIVHAMDHRPGVFGQATGEDQHRNRNARLALSVQVSRGAPDETHANDP